LRSTQARQHRGQVHHACAGEDLARPRQAAQPRRQVERPTPVAPATGTASPAPRPMPTFSASAGTVS
jgi:hypothetical protein